MASPSTVITMGFGNGTLLGSPALILTLGYGIGVAASVLPNLCFTLDNNLPEFTLPRAPETTLEDNRTEFTLEK